MRRLMVERDASTCTYLEPIAASHAVARPIVEILVADDGLDLLGTDDGDARITTRDDFSGRHFTKGDCRESRKEIASLTRS